MKSCLVLVVVVVALFAVSCEARHGKHKQKSGDGQDDSVGPQGPGFEGPGGFPGVQGPQDGSGNWPTPGAVANFEVPAIFSQNSAAAGSIGDGQDEAPGSGKHHGKAHHKTRRN